MFWHNLIDIWQHGRTRQLWSWPWYYLFPRLTTIDFYSLFQEEIPVCQDVTGFTPQSCCPCFRNELCGVACPGDYLTINPASTVSCEMNSSASTTTSSSQITTTELTMASENTTQLSSAVNVTVCLLSCPVNSYYDNSTKQCLKCDDTCLNCAWPDGKDCTVCKFLYNGTCFSMCPENTVASTNETQDGAKLCETKPPYNGTNQELPIGVIAGGAGGVVVITIIIIIIILVYCCRRRGRSNTDATEKRAMSVILEVCNNRWHYFNYAPKDIFSVAYNVGTVCPYVCQSQFPVWSVTSSAIERFQN